MLGLMAFSTVLKKSEATAVTIATVMADRGHRCPFDRGHRKRGGLEKKLA